MVTAAKLAWLVTEPSMRHTVRSHIWRLGTRICRFIDSVRGTGGAAMTLPSPAGWVCWELPFMSGRHVAQMPVGWRPESRSCEKKPSRCKTS